MNLPVRLTIPMVLSFATGHLSFLNWELNANIQAMVATDFPGVLV